LSTSGIVSSGIFGITPIGLINCLLSSLVIVMMQI